MNAQSGRLKASVIRIDELSPDLIDQMWQLFSQSYDDVKRDQFQRDLVAKDAVIIASDMGDNSFQGFSTLEIYQHEHEGKKVAVLFSGDTMLRPAYWGLTAMQSAFARTTLLWLLRHPLTPHYWFLTSMGYRTYLAMARNFPGRYWPRYDAPTPPYVKGLIASLAKRKYGSAWDGEKGVIRFDQSQGSLALHVAPITSEVQSLPEIDFFVKENPDYRSGVELGCIARITLLGLIRIALKMIRKRLVRRPPRAARGVGR